MNRTLALVTALLSIAPLAGAAHPEEQVVTGSLVAGLGPAGPTDLAVFLVGGVLPDHGVDGSYFALAAPARGGEPVALEWTSALGANLDVSFYGDAYRYLGSSGCDVIGSILPTAGSQSCTAPAGAEHVVVNVVYGARADFVFRYSFGAA